MNKLHSRLNVAVIGAGLAMAMIDLTHKLKSERPPAMLVVDVPPDPFSSSHQPEMTIVPLYKGGEYSDCTSGSLYQLIRDQHPRGRSPSGFAHGWQSDH